MFDEKPESGASASQRDGSSSVSSQHSEIYRVRTNRANSNLETSNKYFKDNNCMSAKITVDVTVEFESDKLHKAKKNDGRLANGF
jgi:hypothetical protein